MILEDDWGFWVRTIFIFLTSFWRHVAVELLKPLARLFGAKWLVVIVRIIGLELYGHLLL